MFIFMLCNENFGLPPKNRIFNYLYIHRYFVLKTIYQKILKYRALKIAPYLYETVGLLI